MTLRLKEVVAALDELFGAIDKYRTTAGFRELLEFLRRLPQVGPYNALLLHIQRPGVADVATVRAWQQRGREVKRDAYPLVTLRPFGPVEFVYDITDTTGPALQADVSSPFRTVGQLPPLVLERTVRHAESDQIAVLEVKFGSTLAGRVSGQHPDRAKVLLKSGAPAVLVVEISKDLSSEARYATLVHELAHVYCGHVGVPQGAWWKDRTTVDREVREFEAEAVAWIVCSRKGLDPGSSRYLAGYVDAGRDLPDASLDQIMVAANHLEMLASENFRPKRPERTRRGRRPRVGHLCSTAGLPYDDSDEWLAALVMARFEEEHSSRDPSKSRRPSRPEPEVT
jgi:hypothetical protein